jgi:uncharacterized protein YbaA (DUF1428 family)
VKDQKKTKTAKKVAKGDREKYVDGFVVVEPKNKVKAYKKIAAEGGKIWMKHGALDYKECIIDDPNPAWVHLTFPKMAKLKPSETVWFSYITYKSKAHRDAVNKKVMKDPYMNPDDEAKKKMEMPFDMKRMAYGFRDDAYFFLKIRAAFPGNAG